uniref:Dolichol-phosphate mannosyltransferase subunit 3 n=1 Tax=Oryza nivara TaxID=4536 RepID=A0A0E0HL69_ORYNI
MVVVLVYRATVSCQGSKKFIVVSTAGKKHLVSQMKHIFKIIAMLVAVSAIWIALLETATVPRSYTWLLPIYLVVALGCYGLFMVGFGLMFFPTCPQEAVLLQQDILEAKEFLSKKGVDNPTYYYLEVVATNDETSLLEAGSSSSPTLRLLGAPACKSSQWFVVRN